MVAPVMPPATATPESFTDVEQACILIVDDLPEKHLVFRSMLEDLGELVQAHSGREALSLVLEKEFAVILLDVNMPDIDGLETASLIRQYKKSAQTPIVFITAYVDEIQAVKGYSLGAVDYIPSPVVPEILRSKIKVFVDLYQKNRQLRRYATEREGLARAEAARAAAEEASRRADFLAEASHILTKSIDFDATVQGLHSILVPSLAEVALLTVQDETGRTVSSEAAWRGTADGARILMRAPAAEAPGLRSYVDQSFASREPLSVPVVDFRAALDEVDVPEGSGGPGSLAVETAVVFPLHAGEHLHGSLVLGFNSDPGASKMALIREVVSRAAIAMENALLYRAIQEADQRKNEFLAMLAHELRNPLAPIRNAVHIIKRIGIEDATVTWARDIIGRQVDHMARMVDDLLDVSRIARGKVTVHHEPIRLDAILERAMEAVRPLFKGREEDLVVVPAPTNVIVNGDLIRLAQVLSNLLNNAAKFTAPGQRVTVRADYRDGKVLLSVKDGGEGISEQFLPHVFDLFAQGTHSLDRTQGGLGIGLTLVKHLIELHGGQIEARSAGMGQGAEFVVTLPAEQTTVSPAPVPVDAPAAPSRAGMARILVVEDIDASAQSLRVLLALEGHAADIASDGRMALRKFDELKPDVVLLDVGLPGLDGFEVARQIRARPDGSEVLLVALTGYGQAEDRMKGQAAGFDHHLVKPTDIRLLLTLIARYCEEKGLRRTRVVSS
jgi:signal transduction histidine kinase/CheY-like chemotaxis protein